MNICGCLVHVATHALDQAREGINAIAGAEIHAEGDDGRLVVVVEDTEDSYASDQIMAMHQVPGVLSVTLNFHHFEDPAQAAAPFDTPTIPPIRRTDA
ncbi:chaperone NapD [Pseudooceanicola sp.]|uniref:chaperone NapD n=1 Tax=Pseudooceanicola sp. TaxID=1914328 RepID=UPI0035C752C5